MDLAEEEAWVQDCLRVALPGCAVDQYDDNSEAGMYDLTITYPGGGTGAVEVTASADRQQLELWKLVAGQGKRWIEPGLCGWLDRADTAVDTGEVPAPATAGSPTQPGARRPP
jgi:hypothetical protein